MTTGLTPGLKRLVTSEFDSDGEEGTDISEFKNPFLSQDDPSVENDYNSDGSDLEKELQQGLAAYQELLFKWTQELRNLTSQEGSQKRE